jgi:hypothetical protein
MSPRRHSAEAEIPAGPRGEPSGSASFSTGNRHCAAAPRAQGAPFGYFGPRVAKYNPRTTGIIWLDADAGERAKAADAAVVKGEIWGPLHRDLTVEESDTVAGSPTTWFNNIV